MDQQRTVFNKLLKQYLEYVELYKVFNNGSPKGVTPFADYYWLHMYHYHYNNPKDIIQRGY